MPLLRSAHSTETPDLEGSALEHPQDRSDPNTLLPSAFKYPPWHHVALKKRGKSTNLNKNEDEMLLSEPIYDIAEDDDEILEQVFLNLSKIRLEMSLTW